MRGEIGFRVGLVRLQVVDHVQRAVHATPMSGIGANVGIDARRGRNEEAKHLRLARLDQPAGQEDLVGLGNVMPLRGVRRVAGGLGQLSHLHQRSRKKDCEIVRHVVGIRKANLDRFAGLDG